MASVQILVNTNTLLKNGPREVHAFMGFLPETIFALSAACLFQSFKEVVGVNLAVLVRIGQISICVIGRRVEMRVRGAYIAR